MKRNLVSVLLCLTMSVSSCYDDTALWEAVNAHEERISDLETLCARMNTNISALQKIVEALQNNDCVTGVFPIMQGEEVIGYTITFKISDSITVYNGADGKDGVNGQDGKDGKDGLTPVIGVRQDTDGVFYWTLNGEWLLDTDGNKVRATGRDGVDGQDGADGRTPGVVIIDGKWYVTYDGTEYVELGSARGDCDCCIEVTYDDEYVYFVLSDGTTLVVSRVKETEAEGDMGDLSSDGTANCYIVSSTGTYRFKATVKGNASESVGDPRSADVLWETFNTNEQPSVGSLIKDIYLDDDGYVVFSTADVYKAGNALVAVRDDDGVILWSWHIWMVDYNPDNDYDLYSGHADMPVMDRNLGAISDIPGDVGALGLLYEWGRKDPFLNSGDIGSDDEAAATVGFPSSVPCSEETGTIEYAVRNPMTYIYWGSNYDWVNDMDVENTRWGSVKTIYDPCPAGWRVPDGDAVGGLWSGFPLGQTSYWDDENKGVLIPSPYSDNDVWYPAAGRRDWSGGLNYTGMYGSYWTCSPCEVAGYEYEALVFDFGSDSVINMGNIAHTSDGTGFHRADALSVRCCKE